MLKVIDMEKHKKIGKDIFVSLLPWGNEKFVVQASFGTKKNFVRGISNPMRFETTLKIYKNMRKKTDVGKFMLKRRIE